MSDPTQLRERLQEIDEILAAGVNWVETDESITRFDLESLRKERARIEAQLPETRRKRKPIAYRVTGLGG